MATKKKVVLKVIFLYNKDKDSVLVAMYNGKAREIVILSVVDGKPVTSIFTDCFSGNDRVEIIKIPDSVTYINSYAFKDCANL